jgi:hypothetical protein
VLHLAKVKAAKRFELDQVAMEQCFWSRFKVTMEAQHMTHFAAKSNETTNTLKGVLRGTVECCVMRFKANEVIWDCGSKEDQKAC